MTAKHIMSTPVQTVREDTPLADAARLMVDRNIGCVPVVDGLGRMTGIVSESDFAAKEHGVPFSLYRFPQVFGEWMPAEHVERMYEAARSKPVREIMSKPVAAVTEEESIESVIRAMLRSGFHRIPVHRGGVPVGMITRHDLLKLMLEERTR